MEHEYSHNFWILQVRISSWVVVAQRGDENIVIAMIENLINDAPKLGIQIDSPRMAKYILSDERKAYVQALKAIQGKHVSNTRIDRKFSFIYNVSLHLATEVTS